MSLGSRAWGWEDTDSWERYWIRINVILWWKILERDLWWSFSFPPVFSGSHTHFCWCSPTPVPPHLHFQSCQPTYNQPVFSIAVDRALVKSNPFFENPPVTYISTCIFAFHSGYKCNRFSLQKVWKTQKSTKKSTNAPLSPKLRGNHSLLKHRFVTFLTPFQPHLLFKRFEPYPMLQFINFIRECKIPWEQEFCLVCSLLFISIW